ncbi:MaoC/PaaZ C-terminal domain-containing protein [Micrococcoides hystricis]|uniref:MaoC/PaaZ C-terminal domain-containing protein n=1 Tax=Micrococcoides hystricis TaxID=1572761 RepID=A0ABV6P771_9MICC
MTVLQTMPTLAASYGHVLAQFAKKNSAKAIGRAQQPTLQELHYEVPTVVIEPEKLTDYAKVFGTDLSDQVPAVLAHITGFPLQLQAMADDAFPLNTLGMIHLSQDTRYLRPIAAGVAYRYQCTVSGYRQHKHGTTVEVTLNISDDQGELYAATSVYLAKGAQLGAEPVEERGQTRDVSSLVPQQQWRLLADAGRQYARLSGDMNPIHLNKLAAKVFGMKGQLAHGMYLAGRALVGREPKGAGFRYQIDFFSPVLLPSSVSVNVQQNGGVQELIGFGTRSQKIHFVAELESLATATDTQAF